MTAENPIELTSTSTHELAHQYLIETYFQEPNVSNFLIEVGIPEETQDSLRAFLSSEAFKKQWADQWAYETSEMGERTLHVALSETVFHSLGHLSDGIDIYLFRGNEKYQLPGLSKEEHIQAQKSMQTLWDYFAEQLKPWEYRGI